MMTDNKLDPALSRAGIITEEAKALLVVTSGGIVALLAFIQAIWEKEHDLARLALIGIAFLGVGLLLALLIQPFRSSHGKAYERHLQTLSPEQAAKNPPHATPYWYLFNACQYLSIALVGIALGFLVSGGLGILRDEDEHLQHDTMYARIDPRAQKVSVSDDALTVELVDGRRIAVPLSWYPVLAGASQGDRDKFDLLLDGLIIYWPRLKQEVSPIILLRETNR